MPNPKKELMRANGMTTPEKPSIYGFLKQYASDVGRESMAQGAGHAENIGRLLNNNAIERVGTEGQEYWRKGQSKQFRGMPRSQKNAMAFATDPLNMLGVGLGRLIKPAMGFMKARPALNPASINALRAYDTTDIGMEANDNGGLW